MPPRDAAPVRDAVAQYLARHGLQRRVEQAAVVNAWTELVGKQLASVSAPQGVDASGTLWVRAKSAAWIQELQLMTRTIIRDLAKKGHVVTAIRWVAAADDEFTAAGDDDRSRRAGSRATTVEGS